MKTPARKILVLSSNGGYGHTAAVTTLKEILGNRYQMHVIYPINEVHLCGIFTRENLYNRVLHKGWIRLMNCLAGFVPLLFRIRYGQVEKQMAEVIEQEKPDLVLSVMPFLNFPASEAARKKNVPYLLVTTDNDLKNWVPGLKLASHPHFKVTIGNELATTRELLRKHGVQDAAIENVGLPLRLKFTEQQNKEQLRALYQISEERHVVLLMMGGAGSNCALELAKTILKLPLSVHLIVCAGKNEHLVEKVKQIFPHPSNAVTAFGFTENIHELMALADLLITKPGPGTINEAIAMKLPILIYDLKKSLFWERVNIDMVVNYGIGAQLKNYKEIEPLLQKFLKNPKVRTELKTAFNKIPPCTFHTQIEPLIEQTIQKG